jgi:hypothetical protein
MGKNKLIYINAVLLVVLLAMIGFISRPLFFIKTPQPGSKPAESHIKPADIEPTLQIQDMPNDDKGSLSIPDNVNITPAYIRKEKERKDMYPGVKKAMIDELDANIANSKKALEINPNDMLAKRILLMSERCKKIEMENSEGKNLGKDVKAEDIDTATVR